MAPSRNLAAAAGGGSRRPALPETTATQGTEGEGAGTPRPNATRPPLSPETALQEPGGGRRCGGRRHEQCAGRGKGVCGKGHGSGSAAGGCKRTRRKARALPRAHEHHPREVAGGTSPAAATNTTRIEWGPSKKSARKTTGAKCVRHDGRAGESDASNDRWLAARRRGNGCESTHERPWRRARRGRVPPHEHEHATSHPTRTTAAQTTARAGPPVRWSLSPEEDSPTSCEARQGRAMMLGTADRGSRGPTAACGSLASWLVRPTRRGCVTPPRRSCRDSLTSAQRRASQPCRGSVSRLTPARRCLPRRLTQESVRARPAMPGERYVGTDNARSAAGPYIIGGQNAPPQATIGVERLPLMAGPIISLAALLAHSAIVDALLTDVRRLLPTLFCGHSSNLSHHEWLISLRLFAWCTAR